jgi:hypothetical protein
MINKMKKIIPGKKISCPDSELHAMEYYLVRETGPSTVAF